MSIDILDFIEMTLTDVERRLQQCRNTWGMDSEEMRQLDLEHGTMDFTFVSRQITLSVQLVGRFDPQQQQFYWAWADKTIPRTQRSHAQAAHDFGVRHGLPTYYQPQAPATEHDAWEFACVAACAGHAYAALTYPENAQILYLTFEEVDSIPLS